MDKERSLIKTKTTPFFSKFHSTLLFTGFVSRGKLPVSAYTAADAVCFRTPSHVFINFK